MYKAMKKKKKTNFNLWLWVSKKNLTIANEVKVEGETKPFDIFIRNFRELLH